MRTEAKALLAAALLLLAGTAALMDKTAGASLKQAASLSGIPARIGRWRELYRRDGRSRFESSFLNEAIFRVYGRDDGKTVMLSVSYGADQRERYSLHPPEGCYRAAGLDVTLLGAGAAEGAGSGGLAPVRMLVGQGRYMEPVQYWVVLGGKVMTGNFERKFRQLYYSIFGVRASGVLVNVSSPPAEGGFREQYEVQRQFIGDLYASVDPKLRGLLFGDRKPL